MPKLTATLNQLLQRQIASLGSWSGPDLAYTQAVDTLGLDGKGSRHGAVTGVFFPPAAFRSA